MWPEILGCVAVIDDCPSEVSKCFLCDEASNCIVWRENGYEGRVCRCGMLYTNQATMRVPADPTLDNHPPEFYALPAQLKANWTARYCPPGRLLEIGCGDGFFLAAARKCGYEVWGIEANKLRAQRAQTELSLPVEAAFLEHSKLPRASFDVVYHCDLLAHFADPIGQLNRMTAFLRPGGVLCFEVGILGGVSPVWYKLVGEIGLGQHLWLYSDDALKKLLNNANLTIEKIQYFGLSAEGILGRISNIFYSRLLSQLFSSLNSTQMIPPPEIAHEWHQRTLNFLRYRVGYLLPRAGPQTLFVIARPS
jgi:SAM-dependent methyltransferase